MLRKTPINHLASAVLVLVVWAFAVLWGAMYLGESVSFQEVTSQDFQWLYRIVATVLAIQAIGVISAWLAYGARHSTSTEMARAKRIWMGYWMLQFALSIIGVVVVGVMYLGELFEPSHYAFMLLTTSLETWVVFWAATVLFSPPIVEFIPWGKG
jgi:hypothetical protein